MIRDDDYEEEDVVSARRYNCVPYYVECRRVSVIVDVSSSPWLLSQIEYSYRHNNVLGLVSAIWLYFKIFFRNNSTSKVKKQFNVLQRDLSLLSCEHAVQFVL